MHSPFSSAPFNYSSPGRLPALLHGPRQLVDRAGGHKEGFGLEVALRLHLAYSLLLGSTIKHTAPVSWTPKGLPPTTAGPLQIWGARVCVRVCEYLGSMEAEYRNSEGQFGSIVGFP